MNVQEIKYLGYGKCLKITNGPIKMIVTVSIGPRVIFYGKTKNLLFNDNNNEVQKDISFVSDKFFSGEKWFLYGGHRLWKAPEDDATYYPDNNPVEYKIINEELYLVSQIEKSTGLQKTISIKCMANGGFLITHEIKNCSEQTQDIAVWGLTAFAGGGEVVLPYSQQNTKYLPNRSISFWEYTSLKDKRLKIEEDIIRIKPNKNDDKSLKVGVFSSTGEVYYKFKSFTFKKTLENIDKTRLVDYSSNIEIYTKNNMVEIETITSIKTLRKNEVAISKEKWEIMQGDQYENKK